MTRVHAVLAKTLSPKNRRVDASDSLDVWKYYYTAYGRVHLLYNIIRALQYSFFFFFLRKTWPTCHRGSLNVGRVCSDVRVCVLCAVCCSCSSSSEWLDMMLTRTLWSGRAHSRWKLTRCIYHRRKENFPAPRHVLLHTYRYN